MRFLITGGPTREHWDAIRYLSNASSGKMAVAVAEAARDRKHAVTLVLGPVEVTAPPGVEVVRVTSAQEMHDAVLPRVASCDVFVAAAAVADYRPATRVAGKLRRQSKPTSLDLVPTVDLLGAAAEAAARLGPRRPVLVGFALEPGGDLKTGALEKMKRKGLDLVAADGPAAIGGDRATVELYGPEGLVERWAEKPKAEIAKALVTRIEERAARPDRQRG
ncbi:MAG: phosphopantothenoylcysteine decarboxylase [Planctomycetales bacterium]|nr:phosphopantothenoylcysteine decarboxylase [Planctomycetales bacterium]